MLEVSSPGLERPLKTKRSFDKMLLVNISMLVFTRLLIRSRFSPQGDLAAFDGETLTIDYLDKTRHKTVEIPYQTVAKARLAVQNSKTLSVNKRKDASFGP